MRRNTDSATKNVVCVFRPFHKSPTAYPSDYQMVCVFHPSRTSPTAYGSDCHNSLREVEEAHGTAKGRGRGLPKGEGRRIFRPSVAGMATGCLRAGGGQGENRRHGAQERRAGRLGVLDGVVCDCRSNQERLSWPAIAASMLKVKALRGVEALGTRHFRLSRFEVTMRVMTSNS